MISQSLLNAQQALLAARQRDGVSYRPPTSGNETGSHANIVDQFAAIFAPPAEPAEVCPLSTERAEGRGRVMLRESVNHHPDAGIAANAAGESSHYQLWLLLRLMDEKGQGWIDQNWAYLHLTSGASKWKQYKRPRLRQLLTEGNGRYWQCDENRIWLRKTIVVISALGITRLNGRFVYASIDDVRGGISPFRAYLFSAWLGNHRNPMSRETIEHLTGLSARTQQRYCEIAGIQIVENLALGQRLTDTSEQEAHWYHDGVFKFVDYDGRQGPPHRRYVAWHLPSSYTSTARTAARSQTRHANKQLVVLANITGAPGNGRLFAREHITRRFHANGKRAALAQRRSESGNDEMYWQRGKARTGRGIWQQMAPTA